MYRFNDMSNNICFAYLSIDILSLLSYRYKDTKIYLKRTNYKYCYGKTRNLRSRFIERVTKR
jgi:hypothetical protein